MEQAEGCAVEVTGVNERDSQPDTAIMEVGQGASGSGRGDGEKDMHRVAPELGIGGVVIRPESASAVVSSSRPGSGHVVVPRIGLRLPRQLPFEAWLGIGRQLSAVAASSAWCLGDWLVYGQQAYDDRYRDALEWTGLDYQTLRNYAWVARRFGVSRRRDTLSFGHHAEVASLPEPEQDFWLRKAEQFGWPTSQLRREVRASLRERGSARANEPASHGDVGPGQRAGSQVTVPVPLTPEQAHLCEQAARRQGLAMPTWAAQALDRAARDSL